MTDPQTYRRLFEDNADGVAVLEDLVKRFGRDPYVAGGIEAMRESERRGGQFSVVNFMLSQINKANGVNDDVSTPEAHTDDE